MSQVTKENILSALAPVLDGEEGITNKNIASGLSLQDGSATLVIEVSPERGPHMEPLRKKAEEAILGIDGVTSASVVLTAERTSPSAPQPARHGHNPISGLAAAPAKEKALMPGVKNVIAVASGKGGVGKSTTAVNLALALAAGGRTVGLLDADIYGPSVPLMMNIQNQRPTISEQEKMVPLENYGIRCMSIGLLIDDDAAMIWRGPMVMGALEQLMRDVEWGELDVLVVDLPPGTGDAQLTLCQKVNLCGAVIVSTPQDIALMDARRGLKMFEKVNVPVFGIIENMSTFICPNCNQQSDIFGNGGAEKEAEKLGVDFLGGIPLDISIRESADSGYPIMIADPNGARARVYAEIAEKVWGKIDKG